MKKAATQRAAARRSNTLSEDQMAALAESVGLPGQAFGQIGKGESGGKVDAVGHDPGGTQGLGLFQITTKYNDDIIKRFGGREKLLHDPVANAKAAKAIYDRQGIKAWYGTKFLTDPKAHYHGSTPPPSGGGSTTTVTSKVTPGKDPVVTPAHEVPDPVAAVQQAALSGSGKLPALGHGGIASRALGRLQAGLATKTVGTSMSAGSDTKVSTKSVTKAAARKAGATSGKRPSGQLLEEFWQGAGGIDVKNGQKEPQGFVSGHTDHVHVAPSGPHQMLSIIDLAKSMGLRVAENAAVGPVHRVHVNGSNHYKTWTLPDGSKVSGATDVSGDPTKMAHFAHEVAHRYGIKVH